MGNVDYVYPSANVESSHRVAIPPPQPFVTTLKNSMKETFFPDDPLRQFKNQPTSRKFVLGLQYVLPIFEWGPRYTLEFLKSDLVSGITIASLAIPQGISYAKLANLPPILGLYSSFIPPLVYAMMGSSRDLAVGTVAVASLLTASMLGAEVNATENPTLYLHLAFTATFFAGVFQALLGLLRLGFIVDFLSHATIVGFMAGAATVVCLQQLKGILGLEHFTRGTDIISVMRSVFGQTHKWRWESGVLGCCFLFFLLVTRYFSQRKPKFFWISAMAPLTSVILGSVLVYITHAEKHGVQVIGELKKGFQDRSHHRRDSSRRRNSSRRSFSMFKNYHIDGNKEMIAFGMMNIAGSCTSCYLTTGPFSRSAVNYNAGCKTAVSNIVMAIAVMFTLLFLTPLFHYTPLVVLSAIIIAAMLGLINYQEAIHLWKVDKFDFVVCMSAYIGVVFGSVEIGLVLAVAISVMRVLLFVARPKTFTLGNVPNSMAYRNTEQYTNASNVPGILILEIDAPIYFANSNYLRERIKRWIDEEEDRKNLQGKVACNMSYSIWPLLGAQALALANPGSEVMKKMNKSELIEKIGQEWIFLTVGEAVGACNFMLHTTKPDLVKEEQGTWNNV
ncbi:hypothetical protein M0R45_010777 [Rubus argutus]|uniref:STAS domain-containing protein n=1 Tax=Rubus argutus TaxID=59490 RepID=A0AAW1Y8W0_RUBAR